MHDTAHTGPTLLRRADEFLRRINTIHVDSGISLRELERLCGVHFSYINQILKGERKPSRDTLISLCGWGWDIDQILTDEVLMLGGRPPLNRDVRREWARTTGGIIVPPREQPVSEG
jgi:transcriptional regulator with XRE-family HTH domain